MMFGYSMVAKRSQHLTAGFLRGVFAVSASLLCSLSLNAKESVEKSRHPNNDQVQGRDNGLPNVSARSHPDSSNFDIFADVLVWCAKESGSENWAEVITASGATTDCDIQDVDFGWNAGFRVGLGYGMRHDQWDTQLYYTWFRTRGNDRVSSTPGSVYSAFLGNFYIDNQSGAGISGIAYREASMKWMIHFNMFDWELGRNYRVSRALSLRPFIGLKGGWIDQAIHTKWHNPNRTGAEFFNTGRENLKNNFWGIGPSAGLNTKWDLVVRQNHSFSLFGDISAAIMWGHWTLGDVYKNDIQQEVLVKLSHIKSAASMLRTFMGFGWDTSFSRDRYLFSLRLGYEMQIWLDQLQFYSFDAGRLDNALTLQGGTLELRFDF